MPSPAKGGGAVLALPLLLWLAAWGRPVAAAEFGKPLGDNSAVLQEEIPHLDATAMYLMLRPEVLDDVPKALGLPLTGGQAMLYGGGAGFSKGALRVGVQGLLGGLSARRGALSTEWRLNFGNLIFEQRYPLGQFLVTAGSILSYAQLEALLEDNGAITRYDGTGYGAGLVTGVRWPRQTRMGFLVRAGYNWLSANGAWKGAAAAGIGKNTFDLGGPLGQAQLEVSF